MQVRVPIEVDITYVNKTWFSLRKKTPNVKHYVIGFYQRGIANVRGKAIITAIENNKPETIETVMLNTVSKGCIVYCQKNILPAHLKDRYEIHEFEEVEHVKGDVHINNVNNMWRDLKRSIKREHVSVSKKHLQLYCTEVAWRINHNHLNPQERFEALMSNVSISSRKTFKNLVK